MRTLSKRIAESVNYFIANPKKRCEIDGGCYYSPKKAKKQGRGCAVGFFLKKKDKEYIDQTFGACSVDDVMGEWVNGKHDFDLPKIVTTNINLMQRLQAWHDAPENFLHNGLTMQGENEIENLVFEFELDIKDFNI